MWSGQFKNYTAMSFKPDIQFIDTAEAVAGMIDKLPQRGGHVPSLFVDVEGNNLSRRGTVSLLTVLVHPEGVVYLVDITKLGREAFTTPASGGTTLKEILEAHTPVKIFFDVRNDSDALFSHFDIRLAGVQDLQLMELATRSYVKSHISGLAKCIKNDSGLSYTERLNWKSIKEKGTSLFAPERGGSYAVFDARPLPGEMISYCAQDVTFLPVLWLVYDRKLTPPWREKIEKETKKRVRLSQSASFYGKGQHMALAPSGWRYWQAPNFQNEPAPSGSSNWQAPKFQNEAATPLRRKKPLQPLASRRRTIQPSETLSGIFGDLPPDEITKSELHVKAVSNDAETNLTMVESSPSFTEPSSSVTEAFQKMMLESTQRRRTQNSDDFIAPQDSDHDIEHDDIDTDTRDYTACSAEDCGYCGHCAY